MFEKLRPHILLLCVNLIYAGNYTIAKEAMPQYISPFGFIVLRATAAGLFFLSFHFLFIKKEKVILKDLVQLFICAIFGVATNQLLFFKGLAITQPINAALIMVLTPSIVLLISFLFQGEKIGLRKILGILIGLVGASIIIVLGNESSQRRVSIGDLMILGNATSYGIYLVLVKKFMVKYHPITVLKWVFFFGFLLVLPFGIRDVIGADYRSFPKHVWFSIAYVLIAVSVLTYLLGGIALKYSSPTLVSTYVYLQPFLATLIAISMRRDHLTNYKILAGIMIFLGVYLVSYEQIYGKRLTNGSSKLLNSN